MTILLRKGTFCMLFLRKIDKNLCMEYQKTVRPLLAISNRPWTLENKTVRCYSPSGMPGSGAGKGGGGGGSVKESGGKLGEYGAAQEEHYFFNKQKEQLEKLKKKQKSDKPDDMAHKHDK